jgi:molybdopterin-guanine dinucleotide biosynthesis protein A
VFLSCDMPFVSAPMIRRIARAVTSRRRAAFFADDDGRAGFPCAVRHEVLSILQQQVARGSYSLQEFARAAGARRLPISVRGAWRWFNVNTPADLAQARRIALSHRSRRG